MTPSDPIILDCRPIALKRALTNLIDNAVKYGRNAHITVGTTSSAAIITINDNGPGIPDKEIARVLEPFYRIEESRNRDTGGVGLGLSIALSAVEAHGGQLTLNNRPEGGLSAVVRLPRS